VLAPQLAAAGQVAFEQPGVLGARLRCAEAARVHLGADVGQRVFQVVAGLADQFVVGGWLGGAHGDQATTTNYQLQLSGTLDHVTRMITYTVSPVPDLDHDSPVPLWQQLAILLRADITEGRLTGRVPSAAALALAYHVSRDTALRALAELAAEGLTVAHRGRGTFVRRGEPGGTE
jgi:hypothetical protein